MKKKIISTLLSLAMVVAILPMTMLTASATVDEVVVSRNKTVNVIGSESVAATKGPNIVNGLREKGGMYDWMQLASDGKYGYIDLGKSHTITKIITIRRTTEGCGNLSYYASDVLLTEEPTQETEGVTYIGTLAAGVCGTRSNPDAGAITATGTAVGRYIYFDSDASEGIYEIEVYAVPDPEPEDLLYGKVGIKNDGTEVTGYTDHTASGVGVNIGSGNWVRYDLGFEASLKYFYCHNNGYVYHRPGLGVKAGNTEDFDSATVLIPPSPSNDEELGCGSRVEISGRYRYIWLYSDKSNCYLDDVRVYGVDNSSIDALNNLIMTSEGEDLIEPLDNFISLYENEYEDLIAIRDIYTDERFLQLFCYTREALYPEIPDTVETAAVVELINAARTIYLLDQGDIENATSMLEIYGPLFGDCYIPDANPEKVAAIFAKLRDNLTDAMSLRYVLEWSCLLSFFYDASGSEAAQAMELYADRYGIDLNYANQKNVSLVRVSSYMINYDIDMLYGEDAFNERYTVAVSRCYAENNSSAVGGGGGSSGGGFGGGSSVNITVSDVKGKAGDTVMVDVMVENNTGIASLGLEFDYDMGAMTLDDVIVNEEIVATITEPEYADTMPYHIMFDSTENITFNGTLLTLQITLNEDIASGNYPIGVDYYKGRDFDYIDGEDINFDQDFEPVSIAYESGVIGVYTPGDITDDGKINNKDATTLLRYLAGWEIENISENALDTDGSGKVNEFDATHLLRYIAKWNVELK